MDRKHDQLSFVSGGKLKVIHHLLNKKNNWQPGGSLLIELKDDFKPNFDLVPDHLRYKNLVWTQLRFPTTSGDKKRHASSSGGMEEHTQGGVVSIWEPPASNRPSIHTPSRDLWTYLALKCWDEDTFRAFWWDVKVHASGTSMLIKSALNFTLLSLTKRGRGRKQKKNLRFVLKRCLGLNRNPSLRPTAALLPLSVCLSGKLMFLPRLDSAAFSPKSSWTLGPQTRHKYTACSTEPATSRATRYASKKSIARRMLFQPNSETPSSYST